MHKKKRTNTIRQVASLTYISVNFTSKEEKIATDASFDYILRDHVFRNSDIVPIRIVRFLFLLREKKDFLKFVCMRYGLPDGVLMSCTLIFS